MPDCQCIVLHVPPQVYVAGGVVQGVVEMNFPFIQAQQVEEVHVKLRGSAYTWVRCGRSSELQDIPLVRENISVWSRGSVYPSPGSHELRLPFQFTLPQSLPPSFEFSTMQSTGHVRYFIEAVGVRAGAFRMNRRIVRPLAVVSYDSAGAQIRDAMRFGWSRKWSTLVVSNKIRRGVWGDCCDVWIEFVRPAVDALPLFIPIPFKVSVVTLSKPVNRDECKDAEHIWPVPPQNPKEVSFELKRNVQISAGAYSEHTVQKVQLSGGLDGSRHIDVEAAEKEWMPASGDCTKGQWKQKVTFSSTFVLRCPPTFKATTMKNEYIMHLQAYFGSPFNSVNANVPITITSGMVPSTSLEYSSPADLGANTSFMLPTCSSSFPPPQTDYALSPPELDLPPSYWSTTNWEDHKDIGSPSL